jgi:threonylcarbamoyladenosine tRNA methylthiotransferase MtaB
VTIEIVSFGCRLNSAEGGMIRHAAEHAGHRDTIVVNSCAVTGEAMAQARQAIRRARRARPQVRIVVTGCGAQISPDAFAAMDEVDLVVGNDDKLREEFWRDAPFARGKVVVSDIASATTLPRMRAVASGLPRAYLPVQSGCDHRCTFCVIPLGRGNSRSVAAADVIADARMLAETHAEIVLTGVDLTSYAADGLTLGALARRILREVPQVQRLRISSIDAVEADDDLLDLVAGEPRLMPHLHLSLQAGDDVILKRMKRRHSRAQAIAFCAQLRRLRPDIALGADIIAGFPTETETMFANTLALVGECDLTFLHVFPYSPRPGTAASRMPPVSGEIIRERARRLREAGDAALRGRLQGEIGKTRDVLAESRTQGRTEHFIPVALEDAATGGVRSMTVAGHDGARLLPAS